VRAVINSDGVDTGWMDEASARRCSTGVSLRDPLRVARVVRAWRASDAPLTAVAAFDDLVAPPSAWTNFGLLPRCSDPASDLDGSVDPSRYFAVQVLSLIWRNPPGRWSPTTMFTV
jgi:hypothetical protein